MLDQANARHNPAAEFYALTYDVSVPDWPGEIDFYRQMAADVQSKDGTILEIACGTGRVAIRLAQAGVDVVGLDLSRRMLAVAQRKSVGLPHMRWVRGDMRSFDLGETFQQVIIPGHAFQNLTTPQDQVACLDRIRRHLAPGGLLIVHLDHQDVRWLGDLRGARSGRLEPREQFRHPTTSRPVRTFRAWTYEPATQTAIEHTVWEEIDADGQVAERIEKQPVRLHCVFRFEMEHLLARVGFLIQAVYGDFFRQPLQDESTDMIWVASNVQSNTRVGKD